MEDYFNNESYKKQEEIIKNKRKSLKKGDNVIHLHYLGVITEKDLFDINEKLKHANFELSSYNKSGDMTMTAQLETIELVTFYLLNEKIIKSIILGVLSSSVWESIKWSIIFIWSKLKNKKYTKFTGRTQEEKPITFGFKAKIDKDLKIEFNLEGILNSNILEKSLDQALEFIKEIKREELEHNTKLRFSSKDEVWTKINKKDIK
ncbi:hypothetical protein G1J88_11610 [Tenacibaculum dicentrarchi]|nr:hypothetical protein [Tenacibaculum dicentrarchi]MCD8425983.1 hypothetical protein [Tenacibaculum dicentrarchi]MCG8829026.1 hypothetical protein [Tenacibaculum dicentrarchi]